MTASSGYSVPFSVISDFHEDLNILGASESEYVFTTGFTPETMWTWDMWRRYLLFNEVPTLPNVGEKQVANAIESQSKNLLKDSTTFNRPISVYDVVAADHRLTRMKWLLDYIGYGKVRDVDHPITLFAPVDDLFDQTLDYPLNYGVKEVAMLQVLRYHILNYPIKPWQLQDRVLRLRTDLDLQHVTSDWTKNRRQLLNPIDERVIRGPEGDGVSGFGDPIACLPDASFPKRSWEVEILGIIECDGGVVYILSRPLVFPNVL